VRSRWRQRLLLFASQPERDRHAGIALLGASFVMWLLDLHSPAFVAICGGVYLIMAGVATIIRRVMLNAPAD